MSTTSKIRPLLDGNGEITYPLTNINAVCDENGDPLVIDDLPTAGSDNLVKSGGVDNTFNIIDSGITNFVNSTYKTGLECSPISVKRGIPRLDLERFDNQTQYTTNIYDIQDVYGFIVVYANINTSAIAIFLSSDSTFSKIDKIIPYPNIVGYMVLRSHYRYAAVLCESDGGTLFGHVYEALKIDVKNIFNEKALPLYIKNNELSNYTIKQDFYPSVVSGHLLPVPGASTKIYDVNGIDVIYVEYSNIDIQNVAILFSIDSDILGVVKSVGYTSSVGTVKIAVPAEAKYVAVINSWGEKIILVIV